MTAQTHTARADTAQAHSAIRGRTAAYPQDHLIHQLIERQAARQPDHPAIVTGAQTLSYQQLNHRANQLAGYLRTLGAGPEIRIGSCLPRSPEAVVALLGIVKSGAAPVLIDPAVPAERIKLMLADSGAYAVVSDGSALGEGMEALRQSRVPTVLLDRDQPTIAMQPADDLPSVLGPEHAAHVVYTSGSSGAPKGVVARHETVLQCVHWARQAFALSAADRSTWVSAPGFGVSLVNELWPFLAVGATIELPDEETLLFPDRLRDWLLRREITVVQLVRTLAEPLCAQHWPPECALRLLLATGERFERRPQPDLPFELVITYGCTETTHITSWLDQEAGLRMVRSGQSPLPVGWPVANVSVYLLDDRLDPVPAGAEGEIYLTGPGLARGYLGDPVLTAARWLPDRFAGVPGVRMYRTGDLGRLAVDGSLTVLGRVDRQVKIRGKRVSLDEVEATLLRRPEVTEAAVVAHGDDDARHLVGYLTGIDQTRIPALHQSLKAELPEHLVPSSFMLLDTLPRNANGKLDRQALPAPRRGREGSAAALRTPRGPVERELTAIWSELLDVPEIGTGDNFFEIGGHSLVAVQVVTAIQQRFGVRIDLPAFYDHPTIAGIAAMVRAGREGS